MTLLKDMEPDALVIALRDIVAGKTVVAPDLAPVLARAVQGKDGDGPVISGPFDELTPRETEILGLLAEGQSNKAIARNLSKRHEATSRNCFPGMLKNDLKKKACSSSMLGNPMSSKQ